MIKTPRRPMDLRALKRLFEEYNKGELVYIPEGAEKGDCPYCKVSLERDLLCEGLMGIKEAYICPTCESIFVELARRYFIRNDLK
jgi:hypothetical protein